MKDLFGNEKILALNWREPFATLMLHGKIETRTWNTNYRGLVLICASIKPYDEYALMGICGEAGTCTIFNFLNENGLKEFSGKAIAIGKLVDCRLMTKADEEKCFVKYHEPWLEERTSKKTGKTKIVQKRLYCHVYEDVKGIDPFDWKGAQGWKTVDQETINKIRLL